MVTEAASDALASVRLRVAFGSPPNDEIGIIYSDSKGVYDIPPGALPYEIRVHREGDNLDETWCPHVRMAIEESVGIRAWNRIGEAPLRDLILGLEPRKNLPVNLCKAQTESTPLPFGPFSCFKLLEVVLCVVIRVASSV